MSEKKAMYLTNRKQGSVVAQISEIIKNLGGEGLIEVRGAEYFELQAECERKDKQIAALTEVAQAKCANCYNLEIAVTAKDKQIAELQKPRASITDTPFAVENITIDQRYAFEQIIKAKDAQLAELKERLGTAKVLDSFCGNCRETNAKLISKNNIIEIMQRDYGMDLADKDAQLAKYKSALEDIKYSVSNPVCIHKAVGSSQDNEIMLDSVREIVSAALAEGKAKDE